MRHQVAKLWRYLKGRCWCRKRHRPVFVAPGGYGGRDHLNRKRAAYTSVWCVVCDNRWEENRSRRPGEVQELPGLRLWEVDR